MENKDLWQSLPVPQKYKKWINKTPYSGCKTCSGNEKAGRIKFSENFPSWHTAPPWHPNCDCQIAYITSTKKLDKNTLINTILWDATQEFNHMLEEWKKDFKWPKDIVEYWLLSLPWKKYDIKRREEFKEKADEELYITVYWIKVRLDELWNFLIGRNGYLTSLFLWNIINTSWWNLLESYKTLKDIYSQVEYYGDKIHYIKLPETLIPDDEIRDRRFYYIWNIYAKLESITSNKKYLEQAFIQLIKLAQNDTLTEEVFKSKADKILKDKKQEIKDFNERKRKRDKEKEFKKDWQKEIIRFINNQGWF